MPIFSRRIIQKLLNENRTFLSEEHTTAHVKKLNKQDSTSIATVWEVAILNALNQIGQVEHEVKFRGNNKPDIYYQSPNMQSFVADVTSISDETYDKENPINYFNECLSSFFKKKGLALKGLDISFGDKKVGTYGDQKTQISIPEKKDIHTFIKQELHQIRDAIQINPTKSFQKTIKRDKTSLLIRYNPQNPYYTHSHTCYNVPYSLIKNPLHNRLKKKADQLRGAKYDGIMGVFICDGGCALLNNSHSTTEISQQDIIEEIFRSNSTLSFVIILSLEEQHGILGEHSKKYIQMLYYPNKNARFPVNPIFSQQLEAISHHLPKPESMPVNAKSHMKTRKHTGNSHYGGFSTNMANEIKIPSRMLTELLAGVLKYEKFDTDYTNDDLNQKNMIKMFFLRQIEKGQMIENISVEKSVEQDDDWLKFKFGASDSAITKYQ